MAEGLMRRFLIVTTACVPLVAHAQCVPGTTPPWNGLPFAANSFWNIGVGSGAQWDTSGNAAQVLHGLNSTVNSTDWSLPIFTGGPSDPVATLHDTDPVTVNGKPVAIPDAVIHVPGGATPSGGTDANVSFFDTTQPDKAWSCWGVSFSPGQITGGLCSEFDSEGDGYSAPADAPNQLDYNYIGGVITPYDLQHGSIDHMLRIGLSPEAMHSAGPDWMTDVPWPNDHIDYQGPLGEFYGGPDSIVAGSTFGIPANVDLTKLGLSPGGLILAQAVQKYGAIWKDVSGSHQFTFYSEPSAANDPLLAQMASDATKLMPYMAIMTNQGSQSVNGGGTYPTGLQATCISGSPAASTVPTADGGSSGSPPAGDPAQPAAQADASPLPGTGGTTSQQAAAALPGTGPSVSNAPDLTATKGAAATSLQVPTPITDPATGQTVQASVAPGGPDGSEMVTLAMPDGEIVTIGRDGSGDYTVRAISHDRHWHHHHHNQVSVH